MKKNLQFPFLILALSLFISSCQKKMDFNLITNDQNSIEVQKSMAMQAVGTHNYGLVPMKTEQWENVPNFSAELFRSEIKSFGVNSSITVPTSFLLATPVVRDQGQIGSCTGFCGAETNEILNYYVKEANPKTFINLTTNTGLTTASSGQFLAVTNTYSSLSPLFIYYVERCVINKQAITADNGAYMVNIPQTLQGLSNNTGTGVKLSQVISNVNYYFQGECTEALYPYPSPAAKTTLQYRTAPTASAITNAASYTIGVQSGTTTSTGITNSGYYLINSTNPVADVKLAIANKKPVMMGFNVYDDKTYKYFEGLGVSGYAPTNFTYSPLDANGNLIAGLTLLGGHAVPIVGYIDDATQTGGGVFICQNSWSSGWGNKGYFYMPYSVLKSTKIVTPGSLYVAIK